MDAHGGWIASPADILRFIAAVDGQPSPPDILSASSITEMTAQSAHFSSTYWYGFGWLVRPMPWDLGENWWHTGSLPGSMSLMVRGYNGMSWAIIVNTRPQRSDTFMLHLDQGLWTALSLVEQWPQDLDLFGRMP